MEIRDKSILLLGEAGRYFGGVTDNHVVNVIIVDDVGDVASVLLGETTLLGWVV